MGPGCPQPANTAGILQAPIHIGDRTAIEGVYLSHRIGAKLPLEEDLPGELQRVLRPQLREDGDVSVVIEMPGGFLLYLAQEWTDDILRVLTLSLPKKDYDEWVSQQSEGDVSAAHGAALQHRRIDVEAAP